MTTTIPLGFEVGTGAEVKIPLAHTFVTGQTQLSGKTTTLRAIVERSGQRAIAFITKRGERFDGRRIRPFLPREGQQPIHWRLVETILASALGQRSMKYERFWLIQAAKGATSLAGVRSNVVKLLGKSKGGRNEEAYTLIREYLDLVVPEMQALAATDVLRLEPGLNVMDLAGVGGQLQALVIRACLEQINRHEHQVLTVFPEAWEFAPRNRSAPAKDEAIAMARKGAALGNFLLCDSQDIAGVDTVVRQAASVWILGVQRELNELKRTIQMIPAGIKRPKAEDVATLELGQFYACWGRHAIKTYVWPPWLENFEARDVAREHLPAPPPPRPPAEQVNRGGAETAEAIVAADNFENPETLATNWTPVPPHSPLTTHHSPDQEEEFMSAAAEAKLDRVIELLETWQMPMTQKIDEIRRTVAAPDNSPPAAGPIDEEQLYQRFKARLAKEAPALLKVLLKQPELEVEVETVTIAAEGKSLRGRLALMIRDNFFAETKKGYSVWTELKRTGGDPGKANVYRELGELVKLGFLTREGEEGYKGVEDMKVNVVKK